MPGLQGATRETRVQAKAFALAGLLMAAFSTSARSADREAPPLKSWIDGPTRYVARPFEARQFRSLDSDEDRALFIERFWVRRDPTPDTLTNEYRQLFWQRVQEANRMFYGSTRPGWKTDRGKVYILYGPPNDIESDPDLRTDGLPNAGRGLIRWIYESRPGGRMDLDPITVVAFVKDTTGEYRLSHDPSLSSVFFSADAMREAETNTFTRWIESYVTPRRSELAVMLDLGRLQEVPPQEQVLLETVETIESYETRPLRARLARYRYADEPGDLVSVTVDLENLSERSSPALIARFMPRDATRKPRIIGEGSFRFQTFGSARLAQGRIVLEPGRYDVMVVAADPSDASTALYRGVLVVTPHVDPPQLEISDVSLARELEALAYASLVSYDEPFHLGPYTLVPRLDSRLLRGEPIEVLFEVSGGSPPYRVRYQVEGQDLDGSWIALGRPQVLEQSRAVQAWGLPTDASWPLGDYRVQILVQDEQQATVAATVPVSLHDGGAE